MQSFYRFVMKTLILVRSMPTHLRIYLPLLFLLKFTFSSAQQYHFKNYTVDNGLPFVQVFCMIQDEKGYLWSGGYGGLSRFDGKEFLNFSPKNGLINHYVNAVGEGDSGTIYVGTIEGLSILKNNKPFAEYNMKNGLPEKNIACLLYNKNDGLYLGSKKGLCKFSGGKFSSIKLFDSLDVKCLLKISNEKLAVGTARGLYFYTISTGAFKKQEGLDNNNINCLSQCKETGHLYVGTNEGLAQIENETKKPFNFHTLNGLIDENITSILCESKTSVWVGSSSGLLNFNGNQFSFYKIYSDNNANHIRCIIKDSEDNIWIGTHAGLFRYRDNAFSSFDKETGIGNAFVFQILRDKKGDLWFGTESNGLYKYSQGFFKNYTTKDGLPSNFCPSLLEDEDGTLWIGTNNGVSKFKNGTFSNFTPTQGFPIKGVLNCLYKDKSGTIWTGGQNGVAAFKRTNGVYTPTYYYLPGSLTEYGIEAFAEDKSGNLWMGTFGSGLFRLEESKFVKQNLRLNLKSTDFFMLLCDKNNVLYGATLNGVWICDLSTGKQSYISEKDGLNSELIYLLHLSQNDEVLWIGTNQGINKLNLKKYHEKGTIDITSYGKAEGFTGVECNNYGVWEDKDGTMWFGTVAGVVKYEPKAFKENKVLPRTYFHSITLQNEDTALKSGVVLRYNSNNLGFYYRGICLTNPDKVKYIKKLEGLETSWSEPSSEDYSKYANLPPGSYTFQVKSCNNEGVWQLETAQFAFEIKTAFFKTWWFYTLIVIGLFITVFAIFRFRLQKIRKKEQAEFETKVAISKVELKALRAQMNPHFVFNSLNSIQHYILYNKTEEAAKYLNKFAKLIRIILNNSEKSMVTINEDIESLKLYLELETMRFDGKFEYSVNIDKSIDPDYDEIPPMLMQPYLENAILHGLNPKKEKGHLKIDIFTKDNYIVCRITDDGIGRDRAAEIKRTEPGSQHKSLGMKITSERVRILNSINNSDLSFTITDLKDANQNPCGTMVELYIPHQK